MRKSRDRFVPALIGRRERGEPGWDPPLEVRGEAALCLGGIDARRVARQGLRDHAREDRRDALSDERGRGGACRSFHSSA
jgi:hypothetical protein